MGGTTEKNTKYFNWDRNVQETQVLGNKQNQPVARDIIQETKIIG